MTIYSNMIIPIQCRNPSKNKRTSAASIPATRFRAMYVLLLTVSQLKQTVVLPIALDARTQMEKTIKANLKGWFPVICMY